jgi:hypothetical protein
VSLWALIPVVLLVWLAIGVVIAALIGPVMARNSSGPAPEDRGNEETP